MVRRQCFSFCLVTSLKCLFSLLWALVFGELVASPVYSGNAFGNNQLVGTLAGHTEKL